MAKDDVRIILKYNIVLTCVPHALDRFSDSVVWLPRPFAFSAAGLNG